MYNDYTAYSSSNEMLEDETLNENDELYAEIDESNEEDEIEEEETLLEEDEEIDQNESDLFDESIGKVANCERVYLRQTPDPENDRDKKILDKGTELFIIGETEDWYNVVLANGYEGFVMKEFVTISE